MGNLIFGRAGLQGLAGARHHRPSGIGPDRNPELGDILWWVTHGEPPPNSRIAREISQEIPSRLDTLPGEDQENLEEEDGEDEAREERRRREVASGGDHAVPEAPPEPDYTPGVDVLRRAPTTVYAFGDLRWVQAMTPPRASYAVQLVSLDDLMERDARRDPRDPDRPRGRPRRSRRALARRSARADRA